MKPQLLLRLFNSGAGISLGAELTGDFGDSSVLTLDQVDLKVKGDLVWDVDTQKLPRIVAVELEAGDNDRSHDLTNKITKVISKTTGATTVRLF